MVTLRVNIVYHFFNLHLGRNTDELYPALTSAVYTHMCVCVCMYVLHTDLENLPDQVLIEKAQEKNPNDLFFLVQVGKGRCTERSMYIEGKVLLGTTMQNILMQGESVY